MSEKRLKKIIKLALAGIFIVITAYNLWAYQGTLLYSFLKNSVTDDPHRPLAEIIKEEGVPTGEGNQIRIEIIKSKHILILCAGDRVLKRYRIALSEHPLADKEKSGDRKTPLGEFRITAKTEFSPPKRFYGSRLMTLNYPNREDALRGLHEGLITGKDFLAIQNALNKGVTPPQGTEMGGGIAIHGGWGPLMGKSWTGGSIAMYSKDAEELFEYIPKGAKVEIIQ